jgi:hypothetical protein
MSLGCRLPCSAIETRKFIYGPNGELLVETDGTGNILHEYVYLGGAPVIDLSEPISVPPSSPSEVIIDNSDSAVSVIGANWQTKSSSSAENGSYLQNRKRFERNVYLVWPPPQSYLEHFFLCRTREVTGMQQLFFSVSLLVCSVSCFLLFPSGALTAGLGGFG